MELGSISKLLSGSKYEEHADEIAAMFDRLGIKTLNDLDNSPKALGLNTLGYSSLQLIRYIRDAAIDAAIYGEPEEIEPPPPEPEPEPEEEPEPEAEAEEDEIEKENE